MAGRTDFNEIQQSRQAGRELAAALQAGAKVALVPCPMRLQQGEVCVAAGQVYVLQHTEADAEWEVRSGGLFVGGVAGYAAKRALQASRNAQRKRQALRDAAAQWRIVEQGNIWLTNQRFSIQGSQWIDLWHQNVSSLDCDSMTIELHFSGMPPTRLRIAHPDWWYVMMRWVAYSELFWPAEA